MAQFENLLKTYNPANALHSQSWLKDLATKTTVTPNRLMEKDRKRFTSTPMLGSMYLFHYEPKMKNTLPYYDRFPLIFPFSNARVTGNAASSGGFYGINLHYLPIILRARLMDALFDTVNNEKLDESTRVRVSYRILTQSSRMRYFVPCVKHYLLSQMRSKFYTIYPNEWGTAVLLPLQRFVGASETKIWRESVARV